MYIYRNVHKQGRHVSQPSRSTYIYTLFTYTTYYIHEFCTYTYIYMYINRGDTSHSRRVARTYTHYSHIQHTTYTNSAHIRTYTEKVRLTAVALLCAYWRNQMLYPVKKAAACCQTSCTILMRVCAPPHCKR